MNAGNHNKDRHWHAERDDRGLVWLTLDTEDSAANVLSCAVLEELADHLDTLEADPPAGVVLASGKSNGFIAGADIREFTKIESAQDALVHIHRGQAIMDRIASLPCPTVAMIHGFCMGGGTELALACRYRVADDDKRTRLSLPEVRLGIHPGFGGSLRLPPLIGAPAALDMMLTGRSISSRAAARTGLVDACVPARHLRRAARSLALNPPPHHRPAWYLRPTNHRLVRPLLARVLKKRVRAHANPAHYPAPGAIIDLWTQHMDRPRTMLEEEARSVARLITGDTARNLVRVFFLRERLKSFTKTAESGDFEPRHVHVIGGGVMGGDIAAWCALHGLRVTVQEQRHEALAGMYRRAQQLYSKRLRRPRPIQAALDRLQPDPRGHGLVRADIVIEAIFENVDAKQSLLRAIEPRLRTDTLIATNTSSIPLEVLGTALQDPTRLVGLHFFNPVAKMPLIEVVHGEATAELHARRAAGFAGRIDRLPLPVKSSPGFLVNRILMPYLIEAVQMETEGVPAGRIDRAALEFGMPMGPIRLADTVGLDICLSVAEILTGQLGIEVPDRLRNLVQSGHLGVKSGQGFYRYAQGKPLEASSRDGVTTDLADRMLLRLFNEARACLREGVVEDADLLDAGVVFGTGFAPFRGGPMHYTDTLGVQMVIDKLNTLAHRYGARFTPDPGWKP